jgi:hypothetical protein
MSRTLRSLLIGVAACLACAAPDPYLAETIGSAAKADSMVLRDVAPFPWDTLFVFASYTTVAQVNRALGFSWSESDRIEAADTFVLLVFVANGRVTRFVEQPRKGADFAGCDKPGAFSRANAVFHFATDSTGWRRCTARGA